MAHTVIRAEGLSKRYVIGDGGQGYLTLRDAVARALSRPFRAREGASVDARTLWALRDVSFTVGSGEVLGIVGRNGAGKSTLLKVLSRITEPTSGRVELRGRVASLLEVGTGFHAELTGRENVFLNGAILGMKRREIQQRFDSIVAFAEVERFIDTPVKRYSTGMYLRLGFAVAAHLEPDILVVDEVLAVGDAAFQRKCLGKMEDVARGGRTVLFVSHNMGSISALCSRALLLEAGQVCADGPAPEVVRRYVETAGVPAGAGEVAFERDAELPFQVLGARLLDREGRLAAEFDLFEPVTVQVDYVIRKTVPGTLVQAVVLYHGDPLLTTWDTDEDQGRLADRPPGTYRASFQLPAPLFKAAQYQLSVGMGVARVRGVHNPAERIGFSIVEHSVGTSLLAYSAERPGRLAVPLRWTAVRLGDPW